MATPKQEKLIKLILENLGNSKTTKTLGELILEAGYEESMAKNPYQILGSETIKEGLEETVDKMKKIRDKALKALTNKDLSLEKSKDLGDIVDKIQKNIQLLTGGDTERVKFNTILVKYLNEKSTDSGDTD